VRRNLLGQERAQKPSLLHGSPSFRFHCRRRSLQKEQLLWGWYQPNYCREAIRKGFGEFEGDARGFEEGVERRGGTLSKIRDLTINTVLTKLLCIVRSSVSITTSEKRWSRTCSFFDSPTLCSMPLSTRTSYRTFKSLSRNLSELKDVVDTLMNSVSFVISCKTVRFLFFPFCSSTCNWRVSCSIIDLLQVLSILTMERPVSFSSEDIRDEKVRFALELNLRTKFWYSIRLCSYRSRCFDTSLRSSLKTFSSVNTLLESQRMERTNLVTSKMTLFPRDQSALRSLLPSFTSTRRGGKVFLSSSKLEKVRLTFSLDLCFWSRIDGEWFLIEQPSTNKRLRSVSNTRTLLKVSSRRSLVTNSSFAFNRERLSTSRWTRRLLDFRCAPYLPRWTWPTSDDSLISKFPKLTSEFKTNLRRDSQLFLTFAFFLTGLSFSMLLRVITPTLFETTNSTLPGKSSLPFSTTSMRRSLNLKSTSTVREDLLVSMNSLKRTLVTSDRTLLTRESALSLIDFYSFLLFETDTDCVFPPHTDTTTNRWPSTSVL